MDLFWISATMLAFYVKGLCGFGNTMVFTTLLSFLNDNIDISPVDLILGYPTNIFMAWKERKYIQWNVCLPLAALVILGQIPGVLFLKNADTTLIKVLLGFVLILIGIEMLYGIAQPGKKVKQSNPFLMLIGFLSGLICGIYGIGAFVSAYVSRVTDSFDEFKANIGVVFVIENTCRLIIFYFLGIITMAAVEQALLLFPFAMFGLFLGAWSGKNLNETVAKRVVIIMLMLSGLALIFTNLA